MQKIPKNKTSLSSLCKLDVQSLSHKESICEGELVFIENPPLFQTRINQSHHCEKCSHPFLPLFPSKGIVLYID